MIHVCESGFVKMRTLLDDFHSLVSVENTIVNGICF